MSIDSSPRLTELKKHLYLRNNDAGVKYSVYNNTLIPTVFKSLKIDYQHLIKHVQLWMYVAKK